MITLINTLLAGTLSVQDPQTPQNPPKHWQLPEPASTFAWDHDNLYRFVEWTCYVFFALIMGVLLYSVIKYRRRSEDQPPASFATHHTALEVTWTVVPLIIVMVIFAWGWKGASDMMVAPADSLQYEVKAERWLWRFKQPGETEFVAADFWVPISKPCQLTMSSADVLHSLFIPAFRVKRDVLPGRYQTVWFEATMLGVFDIFCTEYCGENHAKMTGKVHVVSQKNWDDYLSGKQQKPWDPYEGKTDLERGKIVWRQYCSACHSYDGTDNTGPTWKGIWGTEEELEGGRSVTVDEEYIFKSVRDPSADVVKGRPATGMVPFPEDKLDDEKVEWVIEFIKSLK